MKKADIFWQTYLNLEKELLDVSKYIFFTDEIIRIDKCKSEVTENCNTQLDTFSPHIADLLVRTCVEIETISKELYFELGGTKQRGDTSILFDEDCLKLIDIKCKTHEKKVSIVSPIFRFSKPENIEFTPLKEAHKRQGTDWERAYQAVKHDRYYSLYKGTVKNLIHAMAALYLLNIYFRDIRLTIKYLDKYKLDMSFGSTIFSLHIPDDRYIVDVINGKEINEKLRSSDSPYVFKYTDSSYKQVVEANKKSIEERKNYLLSQPEMNETAFAEQIKKAEKREKDNPHDRMIFTWELCKYRINKKMPSNLPFEERKRLFIHSSEWLGSIRQNNHPRKEDEITEENIQAEIDQAGIFAGMELEQRFANIKLRSAFNEGYCELVIDKGDVTYN